MDKKNIEGLLGNYMVVPEIQREYVWGSNKNIVNQFIDSIKDNKDINVGFLYSYSNGNQEYIIDGQQRLTTLVLCLYYASLMQKEYYNDFKSLLKVNSPNMAFTYRVRSNTEEFMQCLFNSGLYKEKEIKDSKWYHTCYDSDLSISSMIALLNYLDEIKFNVKYNDILNIEFWYYPIDETSLGEDLYITMNSRGKTLDNAEKLKPLLFEKSRKELKNWGKIWDDWEDFFFTLLNGDNITKINVAMNNLIRIVWELKTCGEHNELKPFEAIKDLNLSDIELFFDALKLIVNSEFKDKVDLLFGNKKSNESDGNFLILKSLLLVCIKYREDEKMRNVEMKRVYQLIYNKLYRRGSQKHIPLLTLLKTYHERIDGNFYNIALDVCSGDGKDDYFDASDLLMIQIMSARQAQSCLLRFAPSLLQALPPRPEQTSQPLLLLQQLTPIRFQPQRSIMMITSSRQRLSHIRTSLQQLRSQKLLPKITSQQCSLPRYTIHRAIRHQLQQQIK